MVIHRCCPFTKSCPTFCYPVDCSMPGSPVLQHLRLCSNSCPLSQWCYLTISSSVAPSPALSLSQHQTLFLKSQLFGSGSQSIGVSASASVLSMNIQGWFPLGLTVLMAIVMWLKWRDARNILREKLDTGTWSLNVSCDYCPTWRVGLESPISPSCFKLNWSVSFGRAGTITSRLCSHGPKYTALSRGILNWREGIELENCLREQKDCNQVRDRNESFSPWSGG